MPSDRFPLVLQHSLLRKGRVNALVLCYCCPNPTIHTALAYEQVYLENLPSAEMYERSYMHRDVITHTICTR